MRNLRRFTLQEHLHQHELANQVMAEFGKPWLMYIAGLYHDIARTRRRSFQFGCGRVVRFAKQHGLNKSQTALVEFLVAEHFDHVAVRTERICPTPMLSCALPKR